MQMTASDRTDGAEKATKEAGSWSIDDQERLCVVEEGKTLREKDCLGVRVTGNSVRSVPEDIFDGTAATLLQGNPRGL